jgi:hypothetical protein
MPVTALWYDGTRIRVDRIISNAGKQSGTAEWTSASVKEAGVFILLPGKGVYWTSIGAGENALKQ